MPAVALDVRGSIGATGLGGPARPSLAALIELVEASRPAFHADALCREYPEVDFFARTAAGIQAAKAVCGRCLVQQDCRNYGIVNEAPAGNGVWGGLSPDDRRRVRAGRAA